MIYIIPALCLVLLCAAVIIIRKMKQGGHQTARRLQTNTAPFALTRDELLANFRELAAVDELCTYEPEKNFLAWNDGQGYGLHIHLLPDDTWVSTFWTRSEFELRDCEVKATCTSASIPCEPHLLHMQAQGVAICRAGLLSITPATQKHHFDLFLLNALAPREEFSAWLKEYADEE